MGLGWRRRAGEVGSERFGMVICLVFHESSIPLIERDLGLVERKKNRPLRRRLFVRLPALRRTECTFESTRRIVVTIYLVSNKLSHTNAEDPQTPKKICTVDKPTSPSSFRRFQPFDRL